MLPNRQPPTTRLTARSCHGGQPPALIQIKQKKAPIEAGRGYTERTGSRSPPFLDLHIWTHLRGSAILVHLRTMFVRTVTNIAT